MGGWKCSLFFVLCCLRYVYCVWFSLSEFLGCWNCGECVIIGEGFLVFFSEIFLYMCGNGVEGKLFCVWLRDMVLSVFVDGRGCYFIKYVDLQGYMKYVVVLMEVDGWQSC